MRGLRKEMNLLEDSDFGIVDKKEIKSMADFVKNNNGNTANVECGWDRSTYTFNEIPKTP